MTAKRNSTWKISFLINVALAVLIGAAVSADDNRKIGYLSDDGEVVTVAKVPNALALASFSKHLGIAAHGTRVRMLEKKKDPAIPASWIKVEILSGRFRGKTGWVLSQTFHAGELRSARPGRLAGEGKKSIPKNATHRVIRESPSFSRPSIFAPTSDRLSVGVWVRQIRTEEKSNGKAQAKSQVTRSAATARKIDTPRLPTEIETGQGRGAVRDGVTSYQFVRVEVIEGKYKGKVLWLPTHNLKRRATKCAVIAQGQGRGIASALRIAKQIAAHPEIELFFSEDLEPIRRKGIDLSAFDEIVVMIHSRASHFGVLLSQDAPADLATKLELAKVRSDADVEMVVCRAGNVGRFPDGKRESYAGRLARRLKARGINSKVFAYPHYVRIGTFKCFPQCERVTREGYLYMLDPDGNENRDAPRAPVALDRRQYFANGSSSPASGKPLFILKHTRPAK